MAVVVGVAVGVAVAVVVGVAVVVVVAVGVGVVVVVAVVVGVAVAVGVANMTEWRFPYPPPWQDIATLEAHVCTHRDTIKRVWAMNGFPAPVMKGGKQLWEWRKVEAWLAENFGMMDELSITEQVRHATRKAVNAR